jgi:hypothetical protein
MSLRQLKHWARLALATVTLAAAGSSHAATIAVVGDRAELNTIASAFAAAGDTVVRYSTGWANLNAASLDSIFSSDIVWEGDIFSGLSGDVQTRMINFVSQNNGGLMLTAERPCCEAHNAALQTVGRQLTGDNNLLVGGLGRDLFGHSFSNTPSTILTGPNDIRGQAAQHDGPGRVSPTGGISSDACFIVSGSVGDQHCTAAAWGPDVLLNELGRLIIYGDINSQPSLVTNFDSQQFANMRDFLLAGFSGGGGVCDTNPNLPGCQPNGSVPLPSSLLLVGVALLGLVARRLQGRAG